MNWIHIASINFKKTFPLNILNDKINNPYVRITTQTMERGSGVELELEHLNRQIFLCNIEVQLATVFV